MECDLWKGRVKKLNLQISRKHNMYSNTYNPGWKDHPNFRWSNNYNTIDNQGVQQNQQAPTKSKPSPLEETLNKFI